MLIKAIKRLAKGFGITIFRENSNSQYAEFLDEFEFCSPYTMTGIERMFSLYKAVEYIVQHNIQGDFVECGVWKGGSSMLVARTLMKFGITDRHIWLYDTFEGMSAPTDNDLDFTGVPARDLLAKEKKEVQESVWCVSSKDEVHANMKKTRYPEALIHLVEGKVEDSIPTVMPSETLALLRLDTDWYESTKHELHHLFPRLVKQGVLIIDDYGHWVGAKQAVDEYIREQQLCIFLQPIDYTGRMAVKP